MTAGKSPPQSLPLENASRDIPESSKEHDCDRLSTRSQSTVNHKQTSAREEDLEARSTSGVRDEETDLPDPDLVDFDSPDDPQNPRNWSYSKRWRTVLIVSSYTLLSPLSSSMIAPALPILSRQFHVTSSVNQQLMLSIFLIGYCLGPMITGPISEVYGRKIVLQSANGLLVIATIACAVANTFPQMVVFRLLAGLGGSAPLTVGGGTIADLFISSERGTSMALYSLAPLLGPCIGPIIAALLVERTGQWRWIFGITCIAAGLTGIAGTIFLDETYQPRILGLKAARLRKETGNDKLHTSYELRQVTWATRMRVNLQRPIVLLFTQPIIYGLAIYIAITYGLMYLLLSTLTETFANAYGQSTINSTLHYIALAIGFTLGGQGGGRLIDMIYMRLQAKHKGGRPEYKLPLLICSSWMVPAGLLIFGWSTEYRIHWIVADIGLVLFGTGMMVVYLSVSNYLVDTYSVYAASALAGQTLLRSLSGFGCPLFAPDMYEKLGNGWGNSVLALAALVFAVPGPCLIYRCGPALRKASKYAEG